jgi:hypothetical protein
MTSAKDLGNELRAWLDARAIKYKGQNEPKKPDHYTPFHWPVHPISHDYAIPKGAWNQIVSWEFHGKIFEVLVAETHQGFFGRCEGMRAEAMGASLQGMLKELKKTCEPLYQRRMEVARRLDLPEPYQGSLNDLDLLSLFKLFFANDRALAHDAANRLETGLPHAMMPHAMLEILRETQHQNRRVAQWLVLDMLEHHESYVTSEVTDADFASALRDLMWDAQDDYARTIFKAGVVLGGHMCTPASANTILELFSAPSAIARRSAMHASFHLREWMPEQEQSVLEKLALIAESDPEPLLTVYANGLRADILSGDTDHVLEPTFPFEP